MSELLAGNGIRNKAKVSDGGKSEPVGEFKLTDSEDEAAVPVEPDVAAETKKDPKVAKQAKIFQEWLDTLKTWNVLKRKRGATKEEKKDLLQTHFTETMNQYMKLKAETRDSIITEAALRALGKAKFKEVKSISE